MRGVRGSGVASARLFSASARCCRLFARSLLLRSSVLTSIILERERERERGREHREHQRFGKVEDLRRFAELDEKGEQLKHPMTRIERLTRA